MKNIEELFRGICSQLNLEEQEHCAYYIYTDEGFIRYNKIFKKNNICLNIKIKDCRYKYVESLIKKFFPEMKITNSNNYYVVVEINKKSNYIILDYVVQSHVVIPKSFLKRFSFKEDRMFKINYIDINDGVIKKEKINNYGSKYGYYSKFIEEKISKEYETRIGDTISKIKMFEKNQLIQIDLDIDLILGFFDITTYRNPNFFDMVKKKSPVASSLINYDHNDMMYFIFRNKFPHVFDHLSLNVIVNKTDRNFILNDSLISSFICDNGQEVIIIPVSPKICLALMEKEYYTSKWVINKKNYFMCILDEKNVELINKSIFSKALLNKENVLGYKRELEQLLLLYNKD